MDGRTAKIWLLITTLISSALIGIGRFRERSAPSIPAFSRLEHYDFAARGTAQRAHAIALVTTGRVDEYL